MEKKRYTLDMYSDNRLTKIFRLLLGLLCVIIASYWLVYNIRSGGADWALWLTTLFLIIFGCYMAASSFGLCSTYIEFREKEISIKNRSILPAREITADKIESIKIFPLSFKLDMANFRSVLIRFGIGDLERNEQIKAELQKFAEENKISCEFLPE